MKDEIPPILIDAQSNNVEAQIRNSDGDLNAEIGFLASGIATKVCFNYILCSIIESDGL